MTGPKGGGEPLAADGVGDLADAITESFGSFAGFKAQLTKAAATTQGSGWGVAYESVSDRLIVEQVYDHQGNVGQGSTPVLVFDAWGARLLPPVQEPEGRLLRRHVGRRQLAGHGQALRRRQGTRRQPAAPPVTP